MQTEVIRLEFPADYRYLNIVSACLAGMVELIDGLSEPAVVTDTLQLAVHEAYTNVVRHAYAGCANGRIEIELTLERSSHRLTVDLYDTGQPFDPNQVPKPKIGTLQEHGYGLFLMKSLLDEVTYNPTPGRNHWRLVKQF